MVVQTKVGKMLRKLQ